MSRLSSEQVSVFLGKLSHWKEENHALVKTFNFSTFLESIRFVNKIADIAETENHHPDLLIQYNKLTVTLTTHDEHGITGKDFSLAEQIENLK